MTEYDASSVIEERERIAEPRWKRIDCPTCGQPSGQRCGRRPLGVPWGWKDTAPHAARKRAAANAGVLR